MGHLRVSHATLPGPAPLMSSSEVAAFLLDLALDHEADGARALADEALNEAAYWERTAEFERDLSDRLS